MSPSLSVRAHPSGDKTNQAPSPDGARAPVQDKHSLEEIAQRLADLDQQANSPAPASQEADSGQRLVATLDRVGGLIARLQTRSAESGRPAGQPGQTDPAEGTSLSEPRWGENDHRREASLAFRERLAAIRAEFNLKTSSAFKPGTTPVQETPIGPSSAGSPPAAAPGIQEAPAVASQTASASPVSDAGATDRSTNLPPEPQPGASLPSSSALQTALADIVARQRRLDQDPPSPEAEPWLPPTDERFASLSKLQQEIAALTERMATAQPDNTAAEIEALRVDFSQINRAIEPLPERQEALASRLEDLDGRLSHLAKAQVSRKELSAVRSEVAALGAQTARAETLDRVAASFSADLGRVTDRLDAVAAAQEPLSELPSLKARFEELSARTAANTAGVDIALRVERQTQLLAEHLGSLPAVGDVSIIAEQVEALAHQVASDRETAGLQFNELRVETAAIRSRLGDGERARKRFDADLRTLWEQRPGTEAIARLEERMTAISLRVDEATTASQDQAMLDRVDLARFERTLNEFGTRLDSSMQTANLDRLSGLDEAIRELASRLEASPPSNDARIARLEGAINDLADRIEIAGSPGAGPEAIRVLERHVDRLAEQMAGLQEVTIAASERAAMAAVQRSGSEIGSTHVEALAHHLQALNKATAASERRTHNTLEAVHETLETVVARMAILEEEVALRAGSERRGEGDPQVLPGREFKAAVLRAREQAGSELDDLLEPGSGPPSSQSRDPGGRETRDIRGGGSVEFIAAARRAVQSAAAEARSDLEEGFREPRSGAVRQMARIGRRPVVLGIAALVLMMGVIQLVALGRNGTANEQVAQTAGKQQTARAGSVVADRPSTGLSPQGGSTAAPRVAASPLPDPMPPGAFADPETTASIALGSSGSPALQQTSPANEQLPRDIGGPRLRDLAAGGDPTAEYEVGVRYADGRGITANPAAASFWLERAARQNYAPAQYRLAAMFQAGQGVVRDLDAARRWYERAGLLGHLGAMHNLAVMYADGALGSQDYRQASAWVRRAAERGLTDSQVNLGVLLSLGLGVKQDLVEAYKWFAVAAGQGDKEAASQRDGVEKKLDPALLAKARQAVQDFMPLASDPAANVVTPPSGGWDSARLATTRLQ